MATVVTIAGSTKSLQAGDITIRATANGRAVLSARVASIDGTYRPALDAAVVITVGGLIIFGGLITSTREAGHQTVKGTPIDTFIEAADFSIYAERVVVNETIAAGTLKAALQVLDDYLTAFGVTLDGAQATGPSLSELVYVDRTLTDVLDELASVTGYVWEINGSKVFRMYLPSSNVAPVSITDGDKQVIGDLTVAPTRNDYGNRIIVKAGTGVRDVVDERHDGDGSARRFALDVPLLQGYGVVSIYDPGFLFGLPVGIYGVDGTTWTFDSSTNELVQDSGATVVSSSGYILYTYRGQYPFTVMAEDAGEQSGHGLWERVVATPDVFSLDIAQAIADALLAAAIAAPKIVTYTIAGTSLSPGMAQTIQATSRNVASGTYTITNVETFSVGHQAWRQRVTAREGTSAGIPQRYTFRQSSGGGSGSRAATISGVPNVSAELLDGWTTDPSSVHSLYPKEDGLQAIGSSSLRLHGVAVGDSSLGGYMWRPVSSHAGLARFAYAYHPTLPSVFLAVYNDSAAGAITFTVYKNGIDALFRNATSGAGLRLLDASENYRTLLNMASTLTADRTLTLTTGDADRSLSLLANFAVPADPNADRFLFWDDSAGNTAWLTPGTGVTITGTTVDTLGYTLVGQVPAVAGRWGGGDPADGGVYYMGGSGIITTTAANHGVFIPISGTILKASIAFYVAGTLGSNETFTSELRLNNTSNTTINTGCKTDARQQTFSGAMSVAVAAGDYVEAKITCPTWGTDPTIVGVRLTVYIA